MSELENLISEFNNMCGEPETEMGNLALEELHDLRKFVQIADEIFECHNKGLFSARDELIDKVLRRMIYDQVKED